ncbi:Hpt domain-containing protein, partial [bacterium]|nr:Hpt domain-containing protein [bacterium]
MDDELRDLLEIFREEGQERLARVAHNVEALQEAADKTSLFDEIDRELHTLKGSARMLQFAALGSLVHETESLSKTMRRSSAPGMRELLVEAADRLTALVLACVEKGEDHGDPALEARIHAAAEAGRSGTTPPGGSSLRHPTRSAAVDAADPDKTLPAGHDSWKLPRAGYQKGTGTERYPTLPPSGLRPLRGDRPDGVGALSRGRSSDRAERPVAHGSLRGGRAQGHGGSRPPDGRLADPGSRRHVVRLPGRAARSAACAARAGPRDDEPHKERPEEGEGQGLGSHEGGPRGGRPRPREGVQARAARRLRERALSREAPARCARGSAPRPRSGPARGSRERGDRHAADRAALPRGPRSRGAALEGARAARDRGAPAAGRARDRSSPAR